MVDIGDIVELVVDIPDRGIRAGTQGTIVHCHEQNAYEIEVINDRGETEDIFAVRHTQFLVVWRAAVQQWVPVEEQVASLLIRMPEDAAREVLDFARFLSIRRQQHDDTAVLSKDIP